MKTPRKNLFRLGLIMLVAATAESSAAARQSVDLSQLPALVERLGDRSPTVREEASIAITHIGRGARDALRAAASDDDSSALRRKAAINLLRQMPLTDASDTPALRLLLNSYQSAAAETKPTLALSWLGPRRTDASLEALGRVVAEEWDPDVLWSIVARLSATDRDSVVRLPSMANVQPISPAQLFLFGSTTGDAEQAANWYVQCLHESRVVRQSPTRPWRG